MIGTPSGARRALVITVALAGTACGDAHRAAGPSASLALLPSSFQRVVVARLGAVPIGLTATVRVTPEGATVVMPVAGLRVEFPAGAVAEPVDVSVRVASSRRVAYEFEPHGLTFARPVLVEQALAGTAAATDPLLRRALVATYAAGGFGDRADGIVLADEVLSVRVDDDGRSASFSVTHFSGYQLASGRHGGK